MSLIFESLFLDNLKKFFYVRKPNPRYTFAGNDTFNKYKEFYKPVSNRKTLDDFISSDNVDQNELKDLIGKLYTKTYKNLHSGGLRDSTGNVGIDPTMGVSSRDSGFNLLKSSEMDGGLTSLERYFTDNLVPNNPVNPRSSKWLSRENIDPVSSEVFHKIGGRDRYLKAAQTLDPSIQSYNRSSFPENVTPSDVTFEMRKQNPNLDDEIIRGIGDEILSRDPNILEKLRKTVKENPSAIREYDYVPKHYQHDISQSGVDDLYSKNAWSTSPEKEMHLSIPRVVGVAVGTGTVGYGGKKIYDYLKTKYDNMNTNNQDYETNTDKMENNIKESQ